MKFRVATPADAAGIRAVYAPYVLQTAISFETAVPSVEELARRISNVLEKHVWLVAEEGDEIVGYAYSSKHRDRPAYQWAADVSVYLAEKAQGKGLGQQLYSVLFKIMHLQGYYKCYAGIALPNDKSVKLHEAFGFTCLGIYANVGYKNGSWHDVGWWEKTLQHPASTPSPPLPLARLNQKLLFDLFKY